MKAIIFLAGVGSRLKSITDDPKCLIKIGNVPLIIRYLNELQDVGIRDVVMVVGYKQEKIKYLLGNNYRDVIIKYIENKNYQKGSILSLLCAKDEFNDDIITMDGDVIFDKRILQKLIDAKTNNCILVDYDRPDIPCGMKVVIDEQGIVRDLNYKIKKQNNIVVESVGFIKWSKQDAPKFKAAFEDLLNGGWDDDTYEMAVRYLINNNLSQFGIAKVDNHPWLYINYPEDLKKAQALIK